MKFELGTTYGFLYIEAVKQTDGHYWYKT